MLFKNNLLKGRLKANSKLNLSVNLLFSLIAAFSSDTTYRVPGIASHTFMFTFRQAISLKKLYIMYQSIPPAPSPPPPPRLLRVRGICPPCQSRGWDICKFCTAWGPGICQAPGHSRAFHTHAVSYQDITTQKVLLENKRRLAYLSRTGINCRGL